MSAERDELDVDGYLNRMCQAMGGSFAAQQAARDELRGHLRDAARDLATAGMPAREALARALEELGDPANLGRAMRRSRGTRALRRPLTQPAGALLLSVQVHRNLPHRGLAIALAAAASAPALVAL